ncbi:Protein of unknown function [Gryllus bimaculatus]|nr:Protein of unknown function [Gryllus bimaculatus]
MARQEHYIAALEKDLQDPATLPTSASVAAVCSRNLPCLAMVVNLTVGRATIKSFFEIPRPTVVLTILADDLEEMMLRQFWVNTELENYQLHIFNVDVLIGVLYKYDDESGRSNIFIVNSILEYDDRLLMWVRA